MKIVSNYVYINHEFKKAEITMENGVITSINCNENIMTNNNDYIVPGFIDLHFHGCYGANTMDLTDAQLHVMTSHILQEGTTSFLATTTSASSEEIKSALSHIESYREKQGNEEAQILGIHLEGPYLSKTKAGAQQTQYLKESDLKEFEEFLKLSSHSIMRCTLAPEVDEDSQLIKYAKDKNIVVSLGHSEADYKTAQNGFAEGASMVTHLFNGMKEVSHREPNLAGAALLNKDVYCEVIADGHHVAFEILNLAWRLKGCDSLILVTDSNMAKGLPAATYDFNGRKVVVDEQGIARLKSTGSLAGSTAKLNICLKNMVEKVGVPLQDAIRMVSENPAKCIGVDSYKGFIKEGYDADLSVLNKDFQVTAVYKKGKEVLFR